MISGIGWNLGGITAHEKKIACGASYKKLQKNYKEVFSVLYKKTTKNFFFVFYKKTTKKYFFVFYRKTTKKLFLYFAKKLHFFLYFTKKLQKNLFFLYFTKKQHFFDTSRVVTHACGRSPAPQRESHRSDGGRRLRPATDPWPSPTTMREATMRRLTWSDTLGSLSHKQTNTLYGVAMLLPSYLSGCTQRAK